MPHNKEELRVGLEESIKNLDAFLVRITSVLSTFHEQTQRMAMSIGSISDAFCTEEFLKSADLVALMEYTPESFKLRKSYRQNYNRMKVLADLSKRMELIAFALKDESAGG